MTLIHCFICRLNQITPFASEIILDSLTLADLVLYRERQTFTAPLHQLCFKSEAFKKISVRTQCSVTMVTLKQYNPSKMPFLPSPLYLTYKWRKYKYLNSRACASHLLKYTVSGTSDFDVSQQLFGHTTCFLFLFALSCMILISNSINCVGSVAFVLN